MASEIKANPDCIEAYYDLRMHRYSYVIYRVLIHDEKTTITMEHKGENDAPYSKFVELIDEACIRENDCRYGVVGVETPVMRQGTEIISKLAVFVNFCPDSAPTEIKEVYASSVDVVKEVLLIENVMNVKASNLSEIDEEELKSKLMTYRNLN